MLWMMESRPYLNFIFGCVAEFAFSEQNFRNSNDHRIPYMSRKKNVHRSKESFYAQTKKKITDTK